MVFCDVHCMQPYCWSDCSIQLACCCQLSLLFWRICVWHQLVLLWHFQFRGTAVCVSSVCTPWKSPVKHGHMALSLYQGAFSADGILQVVLHHLHKQFSLASKSSKSALCCSYAQASSKCDAEAPYVTQPSTWPRAYLGCPRYCHNITLSQYHTVTISHCHNITALHAHQGTDLTLSFA